MRKMKKESAAEAERKVRSDKKIRVNASLDQETHHQLKKLAISCDMTKTMLAAIIIEAAVQNEGFIDWLQTRYNKYDEYRVIPIKIEGKLHY
ncbi:hypothetical protein ABES38_08785 [Bacillus gobiensis]|uniref:hypothetical protein n=1 Tax=Bacillus gobiensis TaxID=1441095 RepID=UPI003D198163